MNPSPNYKKLAASIPRTVQIGSKEIVTVGFASPVSTDEHLDGCWWPEENLIWIDQHIGDKDKVITYLHELLHAISDTHDVRLTEKQILALEKSLHYVLKPGNIFKYDR